MSPPTAKLKFGEPVFGRIASIGNDGLWLCKCGLRNDPTTLALPCSLEPTRPLPIVFQDICVSVQKKVILKDVSGVVRPGQVLAVMGPSGCGKTTLLDALSGQKPIDSGSIRLHRERVSKKWRRKICYVLQQDIFFAELTLRETLTYTAMLRMPDRMPRAEKMRCVDNILETLELTGCQHTKIGDYMNRGLSGGEKKRANIACELLTNPSIMLLDEPTSGLDSHAAAALITVLQRLALHENKTVVITVHQPSSQMFHMFDRLLLLCKGQTAYFGDVDKVLGFFQDIGLEMKANYNPADFILEQIKSTPEIREKIIAAARCARKSPSYPSELNAGFAKDQQTTHNNHQNNHNNSHHHHHHLHHHNHNSRHNSHQQQQHNNHNHSSQHLHQANGTLSAALAGGLPTVPSIGGGGSSSSDGTTNGVNSGVGQQHNNAGLMLEDYRLLTDFIKHDDNNCVINMDSHHNHHNSQHHQHLHNHHQARNNSSSSNGGGGGGGGGNIIGTSAAAVSGGTMVLADEEKSLWMDSQSHSSTASSSADSHADAGDCGLGYPTGFVTQFKVLSQRNYKEARPRMLSPLNWFQTLGLGCMAGALWFQLPRNEKSLHDIQGWMFFSQTYWMLFALFGALSSFPPEREVINKERRSGAYRLSAYYLAKMVGELPLVITLPAVYHLISYPMLGFSSPQLFFMMLAFLLLNTVVAQSVGFFVGACCIDMNLSITVSALYTLATQLFGGYLSTNFPPWLEWVRYTSMIHYAYQNMQILEFSEGPPIACDAQSKFSVCTDGTSAFIPVEAILAEQGCNAPLWVNTLVLLGFLVVFRLLGYLVLRFVRCPK